MITTISGKMFSGKDTLADLLLPHVPEGTHRFTFSDLIRAEGNPALEVIRRHEGEDWSPMVAEVGAMLNLNPGQAREFVEAVREDALRDPSFTLERRTEGTRFVLQHLGADWRPEGYWANQVFEHAQSMERERGSVIMVGSRYPAEHRLFSYGGAMTVRLDVSRREQEERALKRDGLIPTEQQFEHPGEKALDAALFSLRIDTDPLTPEQVCERVLNWKSGAPNR